MTYKAYYSDKKANFFKVPYLYGWVICKCGGDKCEGGCALPGEISQFAIGYRRRETTERIVRSQPRA
ncbi:hypothetical protein DV872_26120 [Oceanispirochaeta sp. M1]|nr:hypothetical protein DV872_26120 [Oceanispirochaeta sp. M1]